MTLYEDEEVAQQLVLRQQLMQEEFIYNKPQSIDEEEAKHQEKSLLRQVLGQLRIGMDLTTIAAPAFILLPKSFLELTADHVAPSIDLLQASKQSTEVSRMLAITRWISQSMTLSPQSGLAGIKPYNPILGEQFHCTFDHGDCDSQTKLYSEQISHHPPVSTFHIVNEKSGFRYDSVIQPKVTFYGNSVETILCGKSTLVLEQHSEEYSIVLPSVVARGILWGQGCVEHGRSLVVTCPQTKLEVKLDVKNGVDVEGYLTRESQGRKTKLAKIWGKVTDKLYIREDLCSSDSSLFVDMKNSVRAKKQVKPVCDQMDNESRKVWHGVTYALYHRNYDLAGQKKTDIEERERIKSKHRSDEWKPKLFNQISELPKEKMHWFEISQEQMAEIKL